MTDLINMKNFFDLFIFNVGYDGLKKILKKILSILELLSIKII